MDGGIRRHGSDPRNQHRFNFIPSSFGGYFPMVITTQAGAIERVAADAVVLGILQGARRLSGAAASVDRAAGRAVSACLSSKDFSGKKNQVAVLYPRGRPLFKRIILVGLGSADDLSTNDVRVAAGRAVNKARELGINTLTTTAIGAGRAGLDVESVACATAEGMVLGNYSFDDYRTRASEKRHRVRRVTVVEFDKEVFAAVRKSVTRGRAMAEAACFTRDLCNTPSLDLTPRAVAEKAKELASPKNGITATILDEKKISEHKMGCFLGVAKGSDEPPRFVVLEYKPDGPAKGTICLVGKGITFDTGGISLKPAEGMDRMKYDMSGAAAVLGAFHGLAKLQPDVRVIGLTPLTENMPGGHAIKPGDVLTAMNGKTVEVNNTDAEGRLVLADALVYAKRFNPDAVIDLATLTGAVVIALGSGAIGLMGNDDDLMARVIESGEEAGERAWQLPTWPVYRELLKSDVADMKNSAGREAGTVAAAKFLEEFVGDYAWAHLDIAGTAWTEKDKPLAPRGSTGVAVRLLLDLIENWNTEAE
jgi:leucyl aminopeptidase